MSQDAEIFERWEERAAIMEYDGGRSRENAEKVAAIWIRRTFGRVPAAIEQHLEASDDGK